MRGGGQGKRYRTGRWWQAGAGNRQQQNPGSRWIQVMQAVRRGRTAAVRGRTKFYEYVNRCLYRHNKVWTE